MTAREAHEAGVFATFSFVLKINDRERLSPHEVEALYEAGCDDCLVAETGGQVFLDFDRAARTRGEAIASAMAAVLGAGLSVSIADDGAPPPAEERGGG